MVNQYNAATQEGRESEKCVDYKDLNNANPKDFSLPHLYPYGQYYQTCIVLLQGWFLKI